MYYEQYKKYMSGDLGKIAESKLKIIEKNKEKINKLDEVVQDYTFDLLILKKIIKIKEFIEKSGWEFGYKIEPVVPKISKSQGIEVQSDKCTINIFGYTHENNVGMVVQKQWHINETGGCHEL